MACFQVQTQVWAATEYMPAMYVWRLHSRLNNLHLASVFAETEAGPFRAVVFRPNLGQLGIYPTLQAALVAVRTALTD